MTLTDKLFREQHPHADLSIWLDDANFREQTLFYNCYRELGVPPTPQCEANLRYQWVESIKQQAGQICHITNMMLQYGPYPPEEKTLELPVRRLRPMTAVFKAWFNYPNGQVPDEPAEAAFLG